MTIALVVKVHDGIVLAADSATTLVNTMPDGSSTIHNIYNNANKLFNLHKGLPIGALTWGAGNIGPASISTLAKIQSSCVGALGSKTNSSGHLPSVIRSEGHRRCASERPG